jgi:hypothetical protein
LGNGRTGEKPERSKGPREQQVPPFCNVEGSIKGHGSVRGRKPLKRRYQAEQV